MAQLLRAWRRLQGGTGGAAARRIELHITQDVVTTPPWGWCDALVNPANRRLQGTQFTPSEANARLAPDTGIIYPEQSVDGRVDELGGAALRRACAALPVIGAGEARCEVGAAVWTRAEGALRRSFDRVVHTVPPLWGSAEEAEWRRLLASCYASAFALAWRDCPASAGMRTLRLAVPLLGAGAAGAPLQKAAAVAASAAMAFDAPRPALRGGALPPASLDVCFAVIDDEQAGVLEEAIEAACEALPWEASPADGPSLP